jgi:peroxiredoxin
MKRIFTLLICLTISLLSWSQQSITFKTKDQLDGMYLLQNIQSLKIDTLTFVNGTATVKTSIKDVTPFAFARPNPQAFFIFFADPKKNITIDFNGKNITMDKISGSPSSDQYMAFLKEQIILQQTAQVLQQEYAKPDINKDSVGQVFSFVNLQLNNIFKKFITSNKNSNMSSYMLYDVANRNRNIKPEELLELYNILGDKGKTTHFGKLMNQQMVKTNAMEMGNEAPDFTLKDRNGKAYNLNKLRGKYVLLDFWASWCGPCVKEIPNLKKAYAQYKNKGFEIMSVSIDQKSDQWKKALDKYEMPWINVIDNEDPAQKISQNLYYVPSIPRTVLLDKTGKVIGKDFRGNALEQKLGELFN